MDIIITIAVLAGALSVAAYASKETNDIED